MFVPVQIFSWKLATGVDYTWPWSSVVHKTSRNHVNYYYRKAARSIWTFETMWYSTITIRVATYRLVVVTDLKRINGIFLNYIVIIQQCKYVILTYNITRTIIIITRSPVYKIVYNTIILIRFQFYIIVCKIHFFLQGLKLLFFFLPLYTLFIFWITLLLYMACSINYFSDPFH